MKLKLLVCSLICSVLSAAAFPYVDGASTLLYTNVTDPMLMDFAPDGTLYVGRDARGSGGDAFSPALISKVGPNASSVESFGSILMRDPDVVAYDVTGLVSGTPGAVVVGGTTGTNTTMIYKVLPNGTVSVLFGGYLPNVGNPRKLLFNSSGRLFISDSINGQVVSTASSSPPTQFCIAPEAHAIAFDANGRLAVTSVTQQKVRMFSANGTLLDPDFATVKANAPIVRGPGDAFWGSHLYSVNQGGQLIRIDLDGNITQMNQLGGGYLGQVELAFGPDNALYVSELYTDRIYRIVEKNVVVPQPVHWWPGEGNGNDVVGGAHGFLTVAEGYTTTSTTPQASFPAGVVGQSFRFDTNGTAFNFGTNTANVGTNNFTLSFWFKTTNGLQRGLFGKQIYPNYQRGWSINVQGGLGINATLQFVMFGTNAQTSTAHLGSHEIADGVWHHFAMVRVQTNCYIYMDGVLENGEHGDGGGTVASAAALIDFNNVAQFTMGGANGTPGTVYPTWYRQAVNQGDHYDEVQFYDVALDADQISKLATLQTTYSGQFFFSPRLAIASVPNAVRLTWPTNKVGYSLQTNGSLAQPNGWGVLTTNYSVISTNFAVTNSAVDSVRFYRLSKP